VYKCICEFETFSSNKLKEHMDTCSEVLEIKNKAPLCYCGSKLKSGNLFKKTTNKSIYLI